MKTYKISIERFFYGDNTKLTALGYYKGQNKIDALRNAINDYHSDCDIQKMKNGRFYVAGQYVCSHNEYDRPEYSVRECKAK